LPWFRKRPEEPRCYLSYRLGMTAGGFDAITSTDQVMSAGWNIGNYSLQLHYSPTGNNGVTGIGPGSGKRWAVELVRAGW